MSFVQIQDSSGRVFGRYPLPTEPDLSPEVWATEISEAIDPRLVGINGIRSTALQQSYETETAEGVIVDINMPYYEIGQGPSETVLTAVDIVAISTLPEHPTP